MYSANDRLFAFEDQSAREWKTDFAEPAESDPGNTNSNLIPNDNLKNLIDLSHSSRIAKDQKTTPTNHESIDIDHQEVRSQTFERIKPHAIVERLRSESGSASTKSNKIIHDRDKKRYTVSLRGGKWARPEPLVTDRLASHRRVLAYEEAERKRYLDPPPIGKENLPVWGCYIWPYWYESAMTLLGPRLEDLNLIRLDNRVWIEWDEDCKCINISSLAVSKADVVLANTIKGIRDVVEHAKAARVTASPLHLVHPPISIAIGTLIKPSILEKDPLKASKLILVQENFIHEEDSEWGSIRDKKIRSNIKLLQDHLVKNLLTYSPLKHWMRMRIHFGNIVMSKFTSEFAGNGTTLSAFGDMVTAPRFSAVIDRNLGDARLALILKENICQLPETFCSVHGRVQLRDVKFKDTEIIHFQINNQFFRMEGEMDNSFDNPRQAFQMGSITLYKDNRRNVLVETRTIDVERGLDWKLELIADNKDKVLNLPPELRTLIKDSVPTNTRLRIDPLGLQFPDVSPRPTDPVCISSVWVRSIIQYRMNESGYIVEIAIYRRWEAATTEGPPEMFCSISMFHPDWDDETQDISSKSFVREWKDDLSNFFKEGDQCEERLEYSINQIRKIQGYIVQARDELIKKENNEIDLLDI